MYRFIFNVLIVIFSAVVCPVWGNGIRAVWLTTAYGLDWPKNGVSGSKEELKDILDCLVSLDINTVMFQCRIRGDVAYRSEIEPMNRIFMDFDYDPLEYVVDECHKRGMECHAWIVCIPVGTDRNAELHGSKSLVRKKRNLLLKYKGSWYMNPAHKGTAEYISSIAEEIVSNYRVDGIHLDYIRYPDDYTGFPSGKWAMSSKAPSERRRFITDIVAKVSRIVRSKRPEVAVSCATIGKYDDTSAYSSKGWNAYDSLGQDVETWFEKGYVDAVYPMVYFRDNDFYPFVADWKDRFGTERVVPGIGLYKIDDSEGGWPMSEICRQLEYCMFLGFDNIGFYRTDYLLENTKGVFYTLRGLLPMCSGEKKELLTDKNIAVEKPCSVTAVVSGDMLSLEWGKNVNMSDKLRYNLYGFDKFTGGTEIEMTLIDTGIRGNSYNYIPVYSWEKFNWYALTAVDESGNESNPVYISMPSNKLEHKDFIESGAYLRR